MQLHQYISILRRFWLLLLALPLLVGAISLTLELTQPPRYTASAKLMVSQKPHQQDQPASFPDFNLQYSWQSSEYILDDLPQVVTSVAFAEDVRTLLAGRGVNVAVPDVQSSLRAQNQHRSVFLSVSAANPDTALAIIGGAVEMLQTNGLKYWGRAAEGNNGLSIAILDPPGGVGPVRGTRQLVINVALRTGLALVAAVGIAFLLHYLDDTLRDRRQAEEWTGARVMGVIPKE